MNGQGSGGGGALVLLFGLWVVAVFIVVGPLRESAPEPSPAASASASALPSVAEPTPTPDLTFGLACETEADCATPVTRAELAGALDRALDLPVATGDSFADDDDVEQEDAINRLAAAGLIGGCGENRFCPTDPVSRQALRDLLARVVSLVP